MVQLVDILNPQNIACSVSVSSKKKALNKVSRMLSDSLNASTHESHDGEGQESEADSPDEEILNEVDILDALIGRERLGSTALGQGIAVPHGHVTELEAPIAALLTLDEGIEFDAPDEAVVDIIFALLVPKDSTDDHLAILSQVAERFDKSDITEALRQCSADQNERAFEILCRQ